MDADEIKAIRGELGLSQEEFARRLHVSVRTIQNWESGLKIPEVKVSAIRALSPGTSIAAGRDVHHVNTSPELGKMLDALNESLKQNSRLIGIIEKMQEGK